MRMQVMNQELNVTGRGLRIARMDGDGYCFLPDPEAFVATLRKRRDRPDLLTFVERVNVSERRYPYRMEWDNYAVIPVTTFEAYFKDQIQSVARNRARQAEKKGVELREVEFGDELVQGIWEIYNESPLRQGRPYPHYGKSLETVYREEATFPDCSAFAGAYFEGKLIGFIKVVWDDQKVQGGLMNILSKLAHRDKAPTNALVCEGVKICERRGLKNLLYDHYAWGSRPKDNLSEFKDKTGFKRVDVPRYWVPLTPWGTLALQMGLHRSFVDRLPDELGNKLRGLRADWYQWRHGAAKAGA